MTAHPKFDVKRTLDGYRARAGEFRTIELAPTRYLMVDGAGDPNEPDGEYAAALAALYPVAYALKFASKRILGRDYVVPPLEARWWADDLAAFTTRRDKRRWRWTAMLLVPDWLGPADVDAALTRVVASTPPPDALARVRDEVLDEGLCVQTLHVGPYDDEGPVLAQLHDEIIPAAGLRMTGPHHEIYLGDPRRAAPATLRTILRQPVERQRPTAAAT